MLRSTSLALEAGKEATAMAERSRRVARYFMAVVAGFLSSAVLLLLGRKSGAE